MIWVEVWVDAPKQSGCYTYQCPADLDLQSGDIVAVPFGSQLIHGIVVRLHSTVPPTLKPTSIRLVEERVAAGILPPSFWPLLERVATYYLTSMAQVLRTVLPAGLLTRSQRRVYLVSAPLLTEGVLSTSAQAIVTLLQTKKGDLAWQYLKRQIPQAAAGLKELQRAGYVSSYWQDLALPQPKKHQVVTLSCEDPTVALTSKQRDVLAGLKRLGGEVSLSDLLSQTGSTRSVVQSLARKGYVEISQREVLRLVGGPLMPPDQPRQLTTSQQEAVDQIVKALGQSQSFLLHGVTGSGKTEVYLQSIARVLEAKTSALVLVPEIGLTPQLTDRFRARFRSSVLVYHSDLSVGERFDTWRLMLNDCPQVVIGTRSAIFAPLPKLGLIILDEEHDDSYKQDQPQPCYHARKVAAWRSELESCPLLLGSATPSLETYVDSLSRQLKVLSLPTRIAAEIHHHADWPPVTLVDMRLELEKGNRSVLSQYLSTALATAFDQNEQVILFVPRRGYSTFVMCRSCGYVLVCDHCDVSLSFHQVGQQLRCHYCGDQRQQPSSCPACGSYYLKHFGSGTQKVVEILNQRWPDRAVLRFDSDSTSRKGSHRRLLDQFAQGDADVLVGTQMLTKGLDIPNVTLVGVITADGLLNQADFRSAERCFQLLTQVAGRAGRGSQAGQVIIQTYLPEHPTLQAVKTYNYSQFVKTELQHRLDSGYPPYRSMILMRLSSQDPQLLEATCHEIKAQLQTLPAELLGPCPAQVARVSNWHRWQLLVKETEAYAWDRQLIDTHLSALAVPSGVRLSLDIDPLKIL